MSQLDPILRPKSIAVIGASRRPNTIGWQILHNLLEHGFQGPVYPINPKARSIHSVPAFPSVADVPGNVDLAIVVVPKERVLGVALEAIEAGVTAAPHESAVTVVADDVKASGVDIVVVRDVPFSAQLGVEDHSLSLDNRLAFESIHHEAARSRTHGTPHVT